MLSVVLLMMLGKDAAEVQENLSKVLRQAFEQFRAQSGDATPIPEDDLETMTACRARPAAGGLRHADDRASCSLNLYIAARVTVGLRHSHPPVAGSGRPDLSTGQRRWCSPQALVLSLFLSGYAGMTAAAASGAFYFAYVLLGLAVVHYMTRSQPRTLRHSVGGLLRPRSSSTPSSRSSLAVIGLTEPFSPLRRNFAKSRRPAARRHERGLPDQTDHDREPTRSPSHTLNTYT